MFIPRFSLGGRPASVWALLLVGILTLAACSDDAIEDGSTASTASESDTTGGEVDTTLGSVTTVSPPSTTQSPTPTTEAVSPTVPEAEADGAEVLAYLQEIRDIGAAAGQVAVSMRSANNDWDNRSVTEASYPDTEAALVDVRDRTRSVRDAIGLLEPPESFGLPIEHQTAWAASGQMMDASVEALAGLRSPDTGERRRAALAEYVVAYERFAAAIGRIVDIIGVGGAVELPSITTATTAATTTTTEPTPATTTATTAVTETTAATTTTPSSTTTSPVVQVPEADYTVIDEATANNPSRVWLTVAVGAGTSKEQLARVGTRLQTEYRLSREYQALAINFGHLPEELAEGVGPLGTWIDAPAGEWDSASEVTRGDYSTHLVVDQTVDKDWSTVPTEAQMDLLRDYWSFRDEVRVQNEGIELEDRVVIQLYVSREGIDRAVVEAAVAAWEAWVA